MSRSINYFLCIAEYLQSWPKGHLTKWQLITHYFEVRSRYLICWTPLPPQSNVGIVGSALDESTSTLYWGWGGGGGQKDHLLAKVQSVPRLLTRIVVYHRLCTVYKQVQFLLTVICRLQLVYTSICILAVYLTLDWWEHNILSIFLVHIV